MSDTNDIKARMDAAAAEAAKSIPITGTARDLADWIKEHYMKAGYKRLSKIILQAFGHQSGDARD